MNFAYDAATAKIECDVSDFLVIDVEFHCLQYKRRRMQLGLPSASFGDAVQVPEECALLEVTTGAY